MFVTILLTAVILIVSVTLMSIRVIVKKDGKFPNTHIGHNKALNKKGIHCAKTQDREAFKEKNLFERLDL